MTKEHIDLLTKDLCARLPYGVKASTKVGSNIIVSFIGEDSIIGGDGDLYDISFITPYLFPLSSMTEEQENEWNDMHLNPLWEIVEDKFIGREKRLQLMFKSMVDPIQWCYKNNFDCNGLIPLGLAEDATNKNIY